MRRETVIESRLFIDNIPGTKCPVHSVARRYAMIIFCLTNVNLSVTENSKKVFLSFSFDRFLKEKVETVIDFSNDNESFRVVSKQNKTVFLTKSEFF